MGRDVNLVVFPARDLAGATSFYTTLLGTKPYVEGSYYVGFKVGDVEIGLDPNAADPGALAYVAVDDIEAAIAQAAQAGGVVRRPPRDVGGGMVVATVTDPAGTPIGLRQSPG